MRIADEFRRARVLRPVWFGGGAIGRDVVEEHLSEAEAFIDATNVAEYLYLGTDQEYWNWQEDFPCLAPPFKRFAVSYKLPHQCRSTEHEGLRPFGGGGTKYLAFLSASGEHPNGAPLALGVELFSSQRDGSYGGPFLAYFLLTPEGAAAQVPRLVTGDLARHGVSVDAFKTWMDVGLFPMGLALSFMHCKNASLAEQPVPEKLERARRRRGDPLPLLRHHVLEIEPMKRLLRGEGRADEVGLQQALHICRGHFKDYRQSGLFGRHKGLFWWDQHVRGSAERGTVTKEYSVGAPEEPTP